LQTFFMLMLIHKFVIINLFILKYYSEGIDTKYEEKEKEIEIK